MLEICVSLRRAASDGVIGGADHTPEKLPGDIVSAKVSPAVWGTQEKKTFLITKLDDSAVEALITDTVISYPYAVYLEEGEGEDARTVMINRSKYRVDLDMFVGSPDLDPEDETSEPVAPLVPPAANLVIGDLTLDESDRRPV